MGTLQVRMPALSATMEDAELLTWLVSVGDQVRGGQPLAEVTTDKVDMELESPYDGTVAELLAEPGSRVKLGETVATLVSEEDDLLGDLDLDGTRAGALDAPADAPADSAEDAVAAAAASSGSAWQEPPRTRIAPASPPVRKRAKQLGIDLTAVTPTGSRGQVTHADLSAHLEHEDTGATTPATRPRAEVAGRPTPSLGTPPAAGSPSLRSPQGPTSRDGGDRSRRRAIRLATARTTIRSAAVPQFTLYRRIDMAVAQQRRDGRSWTTELARALAAALWRHPECNAVWDDEAEEPVPLAAVRLGIAVDTPDGLVVVGVDDPDAVDPTEADRRVRSAIDRGRAGRLTAEDRQDLSTTISNLGGLGIDRFDALLIPPQPTILSVGRMVEVPVVVDGRVRVRPMMEVGLTVDHRVADGADGARFLETFATRLEGEM
jgi:pyruvate dehydrogenase E2 component (dihydrolipoamide acetyltransferase)